jgi:hypothetical protein
LPAIGRAIGLGVFFLLTAAAFAPLLMLRVPSRIEGLRRLDRNSGLPHRPATAIADEIAVPTEDSFSVALWRAHIERTLRAAKTLGAFGIVGDRVLLGVGHAAALHSGRHRDILCGKPTLPAWETFGALRCRG